ncbi:MAG: hypothetical protein L6290_02190 [Thermodesulfovibrionales bacterium]|nr:hypothetical protein [Thermodesulfovibrionales bacterium]
MKKINIYLCISGFILSLSIIFCAYNLSYAQQVQKNQTQTECQPTYGDYKRGDKWGWYGAKKVVRNPVEAQQLLEKFFIHHRTLKVGIIKERIYFYEAHIINVNGTLVDIIIIDKRNGRIHSAY